MSSAAVVRSSPTSTCAPQAAVPSARATPTPRSAAASARRSRETTSTPAPSTLQHAYGGRQALARRGPRGRRCGGWRARRCPRRAARRARRRSISRCALDDRFRAARCGDGGGVVGADDQREPGSARGGAERLRGGRGLGQGADHGDELLAVVVHGVAVRVGERERQHDGRAVGAQGVDGVGHPRLVLTARRQGRQGPARRVHDTARGVRRVEQLVDQRGQGLDAHLGAVGRGEALSRSRAPGRPASARPWSARRRRGRRCRCGPSGAGRSARR